MDTITATKAKFGSLNLSGSQPLIPHLNHLAKRMLVSLQKTVVRKVAPKVVRKTRVVVYFFLPHVTLVHAQTPIVRVIHALAHADIAGILVMSAA